MIRRALFVILSLSTCLCVSGCWNYRELTSVVYVTALGIEKADGLYEVSAQVINPSVIVASDNYGTAQVVTYKASGESIFTALRQFTKKLPGKLYLAHMQLLILDEQIARDGVSKVLDIMNRDHEFYNSYYILVSRETKPFDIISVFPPLCKVSSAALMNTLRNTGDFLGHTKQVQSTEFNYKYLSEGVDPILPGVSVKGDPEEARKQESLEETVPPAEIEIDSIGVMADDRLVGWLEDELALGYCLVRSNDVNPVVILDDGLEGTITMELLDVDTRVKGRIVQGKPVIDITIMCDANIGEVNRRIVLHDLTRIHRIERLTNKRIKTLVEESIGYVHNTYGSDIFGFGEAIYRVNPRVWNRLEKDWEAHLTELQIDIDVKTRVKTLGRITNPNTRE